jgi:uncharacterized protein YecE (DUF72 family)
MTKDNCEIVIGTSGYSFDDWVGDFYPLDLPKGKRLDYYKYFFNAVEINSTYYRIPHPAVFYNIAKKVKNDFEFIIKTHRSFTHDRKDIEKPTMEFNESISPVVDSGKFRGYLAQFPYSFKYSPANLDYIVRGKELFDKGPYFVEFRHISWDNEVVEQRLMANEIGLCSVDEPALKGLYPSKERSTSNIGYVRFHGRNAANWWGGRGDRYDYLYSKEELLDWKSKIDELKARSDKIYLFFNNCHLGQAVRNAKMLMEILQIETKNSNEL